MHEGCVRGKDDEGRKGDDLREILCDDRVDMGKM